MSKVILIIKFTIIDLEKIKRIISESHRYIGNSIIDNIALLLAKSLIHLFSRRFL